MQARVLTGEYACIEMVEAHALTHLTTLYMLLVQDLPRHIHVRISYRPLRPLSRGGADPRAHMKQQGNPLNLSINAIHGFRQLCL